MGETREDKQAFVEMSKDYSHIFDKAFDYDEALKSTNIAREDVLKLKEKVKDNKDVPRDFPEKLVSMMNEDEVSTKKITN